MNLSSTITNSISIKARFGSGCHTPKAISIGFGVNAKYARPMGVTITSLAVNNRDIPLDFHVFVNSIDNVDLGRLKSLTEEFASITVTVYHVNDNIISHLPTHSHLPLPTYFRFFMPLILKDQERILYLDSDVLCLNNIAELSKVQMNSCPTAAIADVPATADKQLKAHRLKSNCYFNAGVLLINIPAWLEQNITEKALALLADHSRRFEFLDQDALNIILENNKLVLPKKWNYIEEGKPQKDLPNDIILLHCAARPKPWEIACDKNLQAHKLYLHYESLSPWRGLPLLLPVMPTDARIYAEKLFANGNIFDGALWYYRYLRLKYGKKR